MTSEIPLPLIPIALFYLICATVSLFGNMIMFVCFLKEKKFHSPCHYLITMTCLSDMLHLCGHFVFNYQLFFGGPGYQELCFWMLLPSTFGLCLSGPLLLSMGIDRLLACQFPVFYRQIVARPFSYLFFQLAFPFFYAISLNLSSFFQRDPETLVICQIPLAMGGSSFEQFNQGGLLINLIVVFIYFITYLKLRSLVGSNVSQMKVIFKSIMYTVMFLILGWCTVTLANIVGFVMIKDIDLLHIILIYAGVGLNLACASNVFIFYTINSEYRESIQRLFGRSAVHPSQIRLSIIGSNTKKNKS